MDSDGLSESLDESLPLDAESSNACETNDNQQIVCVDRAVGGGVATIERTTMKTPRRHHNVINSSSQTRLLDLSGIATFNRSKPQPTARNARAFPSAARKVATSLSTGGQPVILQQTSIGNVVLGQKIAANGQSQLAQRQPQQQQQVLLLPGGAATASAMLPLVVGNSSFTPVPPCLILSACNHKLQQQLWRLYHCKVAKSSFNSVFEIAITTVICCFTA
jgi:hypothetical protein